MKYIRNRVEDITSGLTMDLSSRSLLFKREFELRLWTWNNPKNNVFPVSLFYKLSVFWFDRIIKERILGIHHIFNGKFGSGQDS